MKLYFTRHGQTDWNVQQRFQGQTDIPLNDIGIAQAYEAKASCSTIDFDIVIASPLQRAYQTAQLICEDKKIEIIKDPRIMERNFGKMEGSYAKDIEVSNMWDYHEDVRFPNGESTQEFFHRVYDFLDDIRLRYPDKTVFVAAHGGVGIAVKCYFEGFPKDRDFFGLNLKNCEILYYEVI